MKKYNFIKMAKNNKCKLKNGKIKVLAKQDSTPTTVLVSPLGTLPIYHTPYLCFYRNNAIAIEAFLQKIRNKKTNRKTYKRSLQKKVIKEAQNEVVF